MNMFHPHPRNKVERVFGFRVRCERMLKKGDMRDSPAGTWELIPHELIGTVVRKDDTATYVRPAK